MIFNELYVWSKIKSHMFSYKLNPNINPFQSKFQFKWQDKHYKFKTFYTVRGGRYSIYVTLSKRKQLTRTSVAKPENGNQSALETIILLTRWISE